MRTCVVPGCTARHWAKGLCDRHYKQARAPFQPPCSIEGCGRRSIGYGRCENHRHDGRRAIKPVKRRGATIGRTLAWGRLYLDREAAKLVEREARRLNMSPSGFAAEIIEGWAKARADSAPSRRLTVCRIDGCERAVRARGFLAAHYQQASAGKPLKPAWEKMRDTVRMGSLRLPAEAIKRLRTTADEAGLTVSEVIRRSLAVALQDARRLASVHLPGRVRATADSGCLGCQPSSRSGSMSRRWNSGFQLPRRLDAPWRRHSRGNDETIRRGERLLRTTAARGVPVAELVRQVLEAGLP